jgi:hypothetical protein
MTAKEIHYRRHISINIGIGISISISISHRTDELMGLSNASRYIYLRSPRLCLRQTK